MMGQVFNMGLDDQNFPNAMQFNPDTSNEERHRKTDLLMWLGGIFGQPASPHPKNCIGMRFFKWKWFQN